jgi:hypothetical protein
MTLNTTPSGFGMYAVKKYEAGDVLLLSLEGLGEVPEQPPCFEFKR